ncbi:MAG: hypothetical protein A2591_02710 [Candidatus Yonathbacteria bacterium RIFOXYD1_FULL_52_36]|uniref:Uncharacterized protein n=1 Tax=Candidatus Yonathbacteria bacterium RIFOXYD1_FULL_52_36 TaxID=1802730 RepID=A0A1G2SL59_9BACT|nr:MAG: hypothetical protein A2591_02710 [Candidatus Yonathbacteria bacterium RIFOXYD1_FULL_52_36]
MNASVRKVVLLLLLVLTVGLFGATVWLISSNPQLYPEITRFDLILFGLAFAYALKDSVVTLIKRS